MRGVCQPYNHGSRRQEKRRAAAPDCKNTVCSAAACSVEEIFRNAVQKPVFAFSGRSSFQNICSDERKKKEEKNREKYPGISAAEERVYSGDVCTGE